MGFWHVFWVVAALTAVSFLLAPKPQQPKVAAAEKFDVPTVQPGEPLGLLFGTREISAPSVVWYGNVKANPIRKKGGKK